MISMKFYLKPDDEIRANFHLMIAQDRMDHVDLHVNSSVNTEFLAK